MPIILSHDGKAWRLVPVVGSDSFTRFQWVEVAPKAAQEQAMEASE